MILPNTLLDDVDHYEITTCQGEFNFTKVTLHFKQWWKFRKVIKIRWHFSVTDNKTAWREPFDSVELRNQLSTYFKKRNDCNTHDFGLTTP